MSNPTGKGGFGERKQQIWHGGRPKSFDALRELTLQIAHEVAIGRDKDTGVTSEIVVAGHRVTVAEKILRDWAKSGDWQRQKGFIEIAFGKVPDNLNVKADGVLEVKYVNDWRRDPANAAPGAAGGDGLESPLPVADSGAQVAQDFDVGG